MEKNEVICLETYRINKYLSFTKGKHYYVRKSDEGIPQPDYYVIYCDEFAIKLFDNGLLKKLFTPVIEFRNKKIDEILN